MEDVSSRGEAAARREKEECRLKASDKDVSEFVKSKLIQQFVSCALEIKKAEDLLEFHGKKYSVDYRATNSFKEQVEPRTAEYLNVRYLEGYMTLLFIPLIALISYEQQVRKNPKLAAKMGFDLKGRSPYFKLPNAQLYSPYYLPLDVRFFVTFLLRCNISHLYCLHQ